MERYKGTNPDSPAAVNFVKKFFPEMAEGVVVYRSAQEVFGDYIRSRADESSCKVKTYALVTRNEDQAAAEETGSVDYAMNAREFFRLALRSGGNMSINEPVEFDKAEESELRCTTAITIHLISMRTMQGTDA